MEKRLILAIALSLVVLLSWSALMPKPQPVPPLPQAVGAQGVSISSPSPATFNQPINTLPVNTASENLVSHEQDNLTAVFNESLGALKEVKFKKYNNYLLPLQYGFLLNDPALIFKKEGLISDTVSFTATSPDRKVIKKFKFDKSNYTIDLEITIKNLSSVPIKFNTPLILGTADLSSKNPQARYYDVILATPEKVLHRNLQRDMLVPGMKFLGLRDQYFVAIIDAQADNTVGMIKKLNNLESEIGLNVQEEIILPNSQIGHLYKIYIGPQDLSRLDNINPEWTSVMHYGTFDFISQILLQGLRVIYKMVHNWGLAIILLSILTYLILFPLSLKQMRSMKEMQILQPKVEALRQAYKDNPQKMNKEIMELYREHKVNPLGGCLPLLLQMPIFFALYNALMRSVVLKGANFLWIKDLSEPDRLIILPKSLPILGSDINILPIIMAIGMFVQQKISSVSGNSASAEQQKVMLIVMPIMFGFIFYRMPSGLVLYWLTNSLLMLVFQLRMNKSK